LTFALQNPRAVGEHSWIDQIELDLSVQPDRWTFPRDRCPTEHTERPPFVALRAASGPPSNKTPTETEYGTRHEDDREANPASEHDDHQPDESDNEPLLCIRKPAQLIN
jgi:hypothetical protein